MATVVIGANFGDEGKGLITDFEVRRTNSKLVVRFNGGSQAGHTVQNTDGRRHVFGHIGAGTFAGADTYLSSAFLVNPLAFQKEMQELKLSPKVKVNSRARVTTIYDMILNGLAEHARAGNRHGSCGMGINETVTRNLMGPCLTFGDIYKNSFDLAEFFRQLHTEWVPFRLKALGLDPNKLPNSPMTEVLNLRGSTSQDFEMHAQKMREAMCGLDIISEWNTAFVRHGFADDKIVFEGAQGLALDEHLGQYPHVTRSVTGLSSALNAAKELGCREIEPVYVTRVYLTRHGAGPLANEGEKICDQNLVDKTNMLNEWQGHFRYAPLNLPQLKDLIDMDLARAKFASEQISWPVRMKEPTIAVTCLDQVGDKVRMIGMNNVVVEIPSNHAAQYIASALGMELSHSSRGPSAKDVSFAVQ